MNTTFQYWTEKTDGTGSGATATKSADSGRTHMVTWVGGHVDADSLITVKDGSTAVFESKTDLTEEGFSFLFTFPTPVPISHGTACSAELATSASDCSVTLGGYTV